MSIPIIVHINPDPDGVRCGECFGPDFITGHDVDCQWEGWIPEHGRVRGPACLAAQKMFAGLVGAGESLHDAVDEDVDRVDHVTAQWQRAIAAIDAGGKV